VAGSLLTQERGTILIMAEAPKHIRRRWYQFGLGTMLGLMTLLAVWLGWHANRAHRQLVVAERVVALGGLVLYDFQLARDSMGRYIFEPTATSSYPSWFIRLAGLDFPHRLILVDLSDSSASDEDLLWIGKVTSIENLNLNRTKISSEGLRHLTGLSNLQLLGLAQTEIDDRGVEHLACHGKLWSLMLDETKVTDDGLVHLERMTDLTEWLGLSKTKVSDVGLVHLRACKSLRHLNLLGTQVTTAGVQDLQRSLPNAEISFNR